MSRRWTIVFRKTKPWQIGQFGLKPFDIQSLQNLPDQAINDRILLFISSRIPSTKQNEPKTVNTGQEPNMAPMSLPISSMNLKTSQTAKAGIKNTIR
jgi:hypothetical protein